MPSNSVAEHGIYILDNGDVSLASFYANSSDDFCVGDKREVIYKFVNLEKEGDRQGCSFKRFE